MPAPLQSSRGLGIHHGSFHCCSAWDCNGAIGYNVIDDYPIEALSGLDSSAVQRLVDPDTEECTTWDSDRYVRLLATVRSLLRMVIRLLILAIAWWGPVRLLISIRLAITRGRGSVWLLLLGISVWLLLWGVAISLLAVTLLAVTGLTIHRWGRLLLPIVVRLLRILGRSRIIRKRGLVSVRLILSIGWRRRALRLLRVVGYLWWHRGPVRGGLRVAGLGRESHLVHDLLHP